MTFPAPNSGSDDEVPPDVIGRRSLIVTSSLRVRGKISIEERQSGSSEVRCKMLRHQGYMSCWLGM